MTVIIGVDPHKSTHTAVAIDRDEHHSAGCRSTPTEARPNGWSQGRALQACAVVPLSGGCSPHAGTGGDEIASDSGLLLVTPTRCWSIHPSSSSGSKYRREPHLMYGTLRSATSRRT